MVEFHNGCIAAHFAEIYSTVKEIAERGRRGCPAIGVPGHGVMGISEPLPVRRPLSWTSHRVSPTKDSNTSDEAKSALQQYRPLSKYARLTRLSP